MSAETTERPEFEAQLAAGHLVVPVTRTVFADSETPVGVYRRLADGAAGTFLLESAEQGGIWSRYSFIGAASFGSLTQRGGDAVWIDRGLSAQRAFGGPTPAAPLDAVAALYRRWRTPKVPGHPPLTGGLVGFIGWEAIRQLEHLPSAPPDETGVPGQCLDFVAELVVLDHLRGTAVLIVAALGDKFASRDGDSGVAASVDAAWAAAQARLDSLEARLAAPRSTQAARPDFAAAPTPSPRVARAEFMGMVERSKDFIRDGDVFQVVLSQRFDHELRAAPIDVYRVLRVLNPSPYMYLLALETPDGEPYSVVGSSPEALVKAQQGHVYMHPIAGSRPRGSGPDEDAAFEQALLADPKERAEHLMLVDLARNDLSKVCRPGSVEVTEFMRVERFSHIMHLVSSVEGELRAEATPIDVFRATFPAGTLSGAPKPRALEIIDELEPAQRGVYGGVVGYIDFAGDADLAIAIRTVVAKSGVATVQAGAGLVADSDPATEDEETRNKAAAPLRAVAIANSFGADG